MSWQSIIKAPTDSQVREEYLKLKKEIDSYLSNNRMFENEVLNSIEDRLSNIGQVVFENKEFDLYKQFSKIEDLTDGNSLVQRPLWKLYRMLQWREDLR